MRIVRNGNKIRKKEQIVKEENKKNIVYRYWNSQDNQKQFLEELFVKLKFKSLSDWKNVTNREIVANGGGGILGKYKSNFRNALKTLYPDYSWEFDRKERNYWKDYDNLCDFAMKLYTKYDLTSLEQLEKISYQTIRKENGTGILNLFGRNFLNYLREIFPNYPWATHKHVKSGHWDDKTNQREFLISLVQKLNLNSIEELKNVKLPQLLKNGAGKLPTMYSFNIPLLLKSALPEYEWKSVRKPRGFWISIENQLAFMNDLKEKLKLNSIEDWKNVTSEEIVSNGGSGLLNHYNNNLQLLLSTIFPTINWSAQLKEKIIHYMRKYDVNRKEDWYRIGTYSFKHLFQGLKTLFPSYTWNKHFFSHRSKKSKQRIVFVCLNQIFNGRYPLIEDYILHRSLLSQDIKNHLEIDVFLPSLNLAVEYQGEQHYEDIPSAFSQVELYSNRDQSKVKLCNSLNISLLVIPYWWDSSLFSLKSTLSLAVSQNSFPWKNVINNHTLEKSFIIYV